MRVFNSIGSFFHSQPPIATVSYSEQPTYVQAITVATNQSVNIQLSVHPSSPVALAFSLPQESSYLIPNAQSILPPTQSARPMVDIVGHDQVITILGEQIPQKPKSLFHIITHKFFTLLTGFCLCAVVLGLFVFALYLISTLSDF